MAEHDAPMMFSCRHGKHSHTQFTEEERRTLCSCWCHTTPKFINLSELGFQPDSFDDPRLLHLLVGQLNIEYYVNEIRAMIQRQKHSVFTILSPEEQEANRHWNKMMGFGITQLARASLHGDRICSFHIGWEREPRWFDKPTAEPRRPYARPPIDDPSS